MLFSALFATFWILAVAYGSHAFALWLIPEKERSLRHVAAALLGASAATVAFEFLAPLRLFAIGPASAAVGLYALLAWVITRRSPLQVLELLGADFSALVRRVFGDGKPLRLALGALLALPALLIGTRALIMPPLGWDTLTYHGVKAAMWVQYQGALPLITPSGWGTYRYYPAGAEILGAWAMLPFSSDLFYPTVDVLCWLTLWPAIRSLCRELDVPTKLREPLSLYLLTVPGLYYWVGSGYSEPVLYMYLVGGSLFLVRFLRGDQPAVSAALALLAFGAAAQVKLNAVPLWPVAFAFILGAGLGESRQHRGWQRGLLAGFAMAAAVLCPMLVRNWIEQGLPLSPYPISLGPLVLGEASNGMQWYRELDLVAADRLTRELHSHTSIFGLKKSFGPALGPLAIPIVLLAPFGLLALWRKQRLIAAGGLAIVAVTLAGIYSPSFTLVRLGWPGAATRFWYGAYVWLGLFAGATPALSRWPRSIGTILVLASLGSALGYGLTYPGAFEWRTLQTALLITAAVAAGLVWLGLRADRPWRGPVFAASLILLFLLSVTPLQQVRDSIRYAVPLASQHGHPIFPDHAAGFAEWIDDPKTPYRIAIAQGPHQRADLEIVYFLLGRRLQNQLDYVPVTRSGEPYQFSDPEGVPAEELDADAWVARVIERQVTHVAALCPSWHELDWMRARPEIFQPIGVTEHGCPLFRVKR